MSPAASPLLSQICTSLCFSTEMLSSVHKHAVAFLLKKRILTNFTSHPTFSSWLFFYFPECSDSLKKQLLPHLLLSFQSLKSALPLFHFPDIVCANPVFMFLFSSYSTSRQRSYGGSFSLLGKNFLSSLPWCNTLLAFFLSHQYFSSFSHLPALPFDSNSTCWRSSRLHPSCMPFRYFF